MQNKNNARNMYKANDIAHKIIKIGMIESDSGGELITNLKLQKLLYYQQGFHLAVFGTPLFEESIEAWAYGPVVPQVYQIYKKYGNQGLKFKGEPISLEEKEEDLFNEVMNVYGSYSAIGLMNMTHSETPWKTTEIGSQSIIPHEKMQHYFKTRLK